MYRFDYSLDDYLRVTDNCANHVKMLLQTRYDELEHIRKAINDRYPFEDLFLKQAEVDDEKFLIHRLLEYLDSCVLERRVKRASLKAAFLCPHLLSGLKNCTYFSLLHNH